MNRLHHGRDFTATGSTGVGDRTSAESRTAAGRGAERGVPIPATAVDLMTRSEAELLAAQFSSEPGERFVHSHLAALRAAAAVLAVRGRPGGRRAPRTAWEMLAAAAPECQAWSVYFAGGAALRRAVEAGRLDAVDAARAEEVLCAAEDFLDEVAVLLGTGVARGPASASPSSATAATSAVPRRLAMRAS